MSMKTEVENASASNFVRWYRDKEGRELTGLIRGEAPDFICKIGDKNIGLEITTAYYDCEHSRALWRGACGQTALKKLEDIFASAEETEFIEIYQPEQQLIESINNVLVKKCTKSYGPSTILLIRVPSHPLTTASEFVSRVVPFISIPTENPFREVYVASDQAGFFRVM